MALFLLSFFNFFLFFVPTFHFHFACRAHILHLGSETGDLLTFQLGDITQQRKLVIQ